MVERVLAAHPGVRGLRGRRVVPDAEWGERVVAVVQPVDWARRRRSRTCGRSRPTPWSRPPCRGSSCRSGLLPLLASGKPDKAAVRTLLRDRA